MYKLVRVDTEDANEIQLPEGTFLIGREKLIGFDDKRISWNHGLIFVKEDSVIIESSQRKLYLTKKGSKEKEVLNKTFKTTLDIGDRFGFLEDCYWYEVATGQDRALKEINGNTSVKSSHFTMEPSSVIGQSSEDEEIPRKRKSRANRDSRKSKRRRKESDEESESEALTGSEEDEVMSAATQKRERCKYGADCYSLRTLRRDNPAHKAHTTQYSHPRDSDWGAAVLKMCPLGASCLRTGPRHAKRFKHPPGYKNPGPVPRTKANKYWHAHSIYSESDTDSSVERNVALRSKRERKQKPKEDVAELEDSEQEEEDPFASDDSEDWKPDLDDHF